MYLKDQAFLEEQDIIHLAPSVYSERPDATAVSENYSFIPTYHVMEVLEAMGWRVVYAAQSKTRSPYGHEYVKHVLRFRNPDQMEKTLIEVGDSVAELVFTNGHDGTTACQMMLGLFKLLCANGLMANEGTFSGFRTKHKDITDKDIIEASYRVIEQVPQITEKVAQFRNINLSGAEREVFALNAAKLRWDEEMPINPNHLLLPKRIQESGKDLWTTLNVVQENIIRGGVKLTKESKFKNSRKVSSVNEDLRINKGLWSLAEKTFEHRSRWS
jgi:hypothetical protein